MRCFSNIARGVLFILTLWALASFPTGCGKDDTPNDPGGTPDPAPYGKGTVAFDAAGAGGHFSASGAYTPSTEFADDSASQGSGGFLHDTVSVGKPYQSRLNAYIHTLSGGYMSERVLVLTLNNAEGALAPGTYDIIHNDATGSGRSARVTYLFFSDSLAEYAAFEGASGTITIAVLDTLTREIHGTFIGTLRSAPPDTSRHIELVTGTFELFLSNRYYNY